MRIRFRADLSAIAAIAAIAVLGSACAGPLAPPVEFQSKPTESIYVIGPGDLIRVSVWKNPELSADVPVRPDGNISVALLDDVQADGLTTEELKQVITTELNEFITNPDVTVVVLQTNSKRVFVLGEVQRPGPILMAAELRVLDVISIAGGFGPFADKSEVRVLRVIEGVEREFRFDYGAFLAGDAAGTNIVLQPGDAIVVPD